MLESGALSDDGFPEFGKEVVLFIHITTQIEGRKDEKLFSEIGGTGFPHVVAMNPAGKVIGELHWEKRTVDGCRELMKDGKAFTELMAKAEKGDNGARIEYFPKALKLGHFKLAEAKTYYAGLKNVPAEAKKEIDGLLAGLEMKDILAPLSRPIMDRAKVKELQVAAGRKLWEMEQGSRVPGEEDDAITFYALIVIAAEEDKNLPAFERGLSVLKDRFGSKVKRFIDQKQPVLDKLKEEKEEKKDK